MAIGLNIKTKENLIRLWQSHDPRNHELAFQMLGGIDLEDDDFGWLWDFYQNFPTQNTRRTTLLNFPNISEKDVIKGRILDILLMSSPITQNIFSTFKKNNSIRIPYTTSTTIPPSLFSQTFDIEEFIWQDGEIQSIPTEIIQFQSLKRLDMRRQPIEFIHHHIAELPLLEEIYLISTSFLPPELIDRADIEIYTDAPY